MDKHSKHMIFIHSFSIFGNFTIMYFDGDPVLPPSIPYRIFTFPTPHNFGSSNFFNNLLNSTCTTHIPMGMDLSTGVECSFPPGARP